MGTTKGWTKGWTKWTTPKLYKYSIETHTVSVQGDFERMQLCLWCIMVCIVWEWQRHGETPWVFTAAMTPVLIMASRITCRVWLGNSTPINNLNKLDTAISPNDSLHSPLDSRVLSFCPPKNCCSFCTWYQGDPGEPLKLPLSHLMILVENAFPIPRSLT
jgi:hypothetical protein